MKSNKTTPRHGVFSARPTWAHSEAYAVPARENVPPWSRSEVPQHRIRAWIECQHGIRSCARLELEALRRGDDELARDYQSLRLDYQDMLSSLTADMTTP